jgi:hypothetical protein
MRKKCNPKIDHTEVGDMNGYRRGCRGYDCVKGHDRQYDLDRRSKGALNRLGSMYVPQNDGIYDVDVTLTYKQWKDANQYDKKTGTYGN